jgi:predicted RNase H-like HicB family nuclease
MERKLFGFSVVVIPEGKTYSSWCPDIDVASQGRTVEEAIHNLKEALELHLECLNPNERQEVRKRQGTRLITTLELPLA